MNKITDIEIQKRNKERVNIYVDGEFTFACDTEFIYREKLKVGLVLDIEKVKRIVIEDEFKKCKNTALRIIERNYKSQKEVYDKLLEKGYDEEISKEAIDFLKSYSYIDDSRYAQMYIRDKLKSQGQSKIKYALLRKGISDEIIKNAFLENSDENLEFETAMNLAKKRFVILAKSETDKYKLSQKLYRFLVSKGYGFELISSVVKKVTNDEEDYYES